MSSKKKVAKKKTKKKRIVKTAPGRSLKEARAAAIAAEEKEQGGPFWPWPLRPYQQDAYDKYTAGIKRHMHIWHRRAGKDVFCLSLARNESRKRIGGYIHFFPKHVQAKRAIWQGIDPKKGARFIDIAFGDQEADRNNTDMLIEMYNGSTWQLLGSDNYDRIVGSNAVGVVFSEWALCDPRSWDFIRPIIRENDGWAMFITTYRGRNHAWQMHQKLKDNPAWNCTTLTVDDSRDIEGNRILTEADIQAERDEGMSEALIQQEYYCNPEAVLDGAIYGRQVEAFRRDTSRHTAYWNPNKPVYCVWNIDVPIFASYILVQPGEPPTILEANTLPFTSVGEALAKAEQQRFPILQHIISGEQRELVTHIHGHNRNPEVVANINTLNATTATASLLERCFINMDKAEILIDALGGYVRREHFNAQVADIQYSQEPVVSWHRQLSEALETWAIREYHSGNTGFMSKPDYTIQDRIARTILE